MVATWFSWVLSAPKSVPFVGLLPRGDVSGEILL
jgi:hypothetical protein